MSVDAKFYYAVGVFAVLHAVLWLLYGAQLLIQLRIFTVNKRLTDSQRQGSSNDSNDRSTHTNTNSGAGAGDGGAASPLPETLASSGSGLSTSPRSDAPNDRTDAGATGSAQNLLDSHQHGSSSRIELTEVAAHNRANRLRLMASDPDAVPTDEHAIAQIDSSQRPETPFGQLVNNNPALDSTPNASKPGSASDLKASMVVPDISASVVNVPASDAGDDPTYSASPAQSNRSVAVIRQSSGYFPSTPSVSVRSVDPQYPNPYEQTPSQSNRSIAVVRTNNAGADEYATPSVSVRSLDPVGTGVTPSFSHRSIHQSNPPGQTPSISARSVTVTDTITPVSEHRSLSRPALPLSIDIVPNAIAEGDERSPGSRHGDQQPAARSHSLEPAKTIDAAAAKSPDSILVPSLPPTTPTPAPAPVRSSSDSDERAPVEPPRRPSNLRQLSREQQPPPQQQQSQNFKGASSRQATARPSVIAHSASAQIAVPRIGSLQRVFHPLGFIAQTVQLAVIVDYYGVFGIYEWYGWLVSINALNFIIAAGSAYTVYHFLKLRYGTLVVSMPGWIKWVISALVVAFGLEVLAINIIRVIMGLQYWSSTINLIALMVVEVVLISVFIVSVVHLFRIIYSLDAKVHRRPTAAASLKAVQDPQISIFNAILRVFCCIFVSDPAPKSTEEPLAPPHAVRQSSASVRESSVHNELQVVTVVGQSADSAGAPAANAGGGADSLHFSRASTLNRTSTLSKGPNSSAATNTTFSRVLTHMRRLAFAGSFVVFLCLLLQFYVVTGYLGKSPTATLDPIEPENFSTGLGNLGFMVLHYLFLATGFYFSKLPIVYLWTDFASDGSSHKRKKTKRSKDTKPQQIESALVAVGQAQ